MSFANRFGVGGVGDGNNNNSSVTTELFDTAIPRSVIPLYNADPKCQCQTSEKNTTDFIMHGVKVTSSSNNDTNRSDEGAPLVLLHGYSNGALYYYRNLVGLSNTHFGGVVYALDMLGWGLSSRPAFKLKSAVDGCDGVDTAEAFFVESLEAWRKGSGLEKMTLGGHSLGGYISVAYCEKYPQHVERLILISPAGVPHEEDQDTSTHKNLPLKVKIVLSLFSGLWRSGITPPSFVKSLPEDRGRKLVNGYVERRLPAITCAKERESLGEYSYCNAVLPGSGADCLNTILKPMAFARKPTIDRIPLLDVRDISFIYGQNDWMDPSAGLAVQQKCEELRTSGTKTPNVSVFGVKDAGHLLMLENWEEFNSAVVLAGGGGKRLSKEARLPFRCSCLDGSATNFFNKPRVLSNTVK